LTEQNILLTFHIDREVPEGRGSEERKIVGIYLLSKRNTRTVPKQKSTSYCVEEEIVMRDGVTERIINKEIINYGVALQLGPYVDWINETIRYHRSALSWGK